MEALHEVVRAGKARYYFGASAMWAWQLAKMQYTASGNGWTRLRVHAGPVQPADARGGPRMDVDPVGRRFDIDADAPIVDTVERIAAQRDVPMAQVETSDWAPSDIPPGSITTCAGVASQA